jgi:phytoene desaturase
VTVLEQAPTVGGALGRFVRDGYTFDTGATSLTLPAVFRDLFRATGRPLERELELVPVEPSRRFWFTDGRQVDLANASRARTTAALDAALGPGAGSQWATVLRHGERIWRIVRRPLLDRPPTGRDLVVVAARLSAAGARRSVRTWLERVVPDPRVRAMVESQVAWTGSDPRRAPAALAALPYLEHAFGTWYIRGGMHGLAQALADRATVRGATVRTNCPVAEVLVTDGRVTGVASDDGERHSADVVVVATPQLAGPAGRGPSAPTALPPSLFTLLLALRGRTPNMAHHTVLLPDDGDAELDWLSAPRPAAAPEPTLHICVPDDPATRPAGGEAWTVHARVPRHGQDATGVLDWTAAGFVSSFADRLLDVLSARGLDVRGRLVWRVIHSPADREHATRAPGGAVGGLVRAGFRPAWRRPTGRSPVRGLYVVGAATQPAPGLPFVGRSAAVTADVVGRAG